MPGEIVAIYGLLGAGRSELFECLIGASQVASGRIELLGVNITRASTASRIERGLVLVPEDRQRDGIIALLPVSQNLSMASIAHFTRLWVINRAAEAKAVSGSIHDLAIKVSSPDVPVSALSGGNQQKVVIGKGLLTGPRVILFDEPTRGIDVGAKAEVFRTMGALAREGIGVVYATSDIKEVMSAADRIVVMSAGRVTGNFPRAEVNEAIVLAASIEGLRHLTGETRKQAS